MSKYKKLKEYIHGLFRKTRITGKYVKMRCLLALLDFKSYACASLGSEECLLHGWAVKTIN